MLPRPHGKRARLFSSFLVPASPHNCTSKHDFPYVNEGFLFAFCLKISFRRKCPSSRDLHTHIDDLPWKGICSWLLNGLWEEKRLTTIFGCLTCRAKQPIGEKAEKGGREGGIFFTALFYGLGFFLCVVCGKYEKSLDVQR